MEKKEMKPTVENLRRIALDEEMEEMRIKTSKKQAKIRKEQAKHKQYLIDNDMEHLTSTERYWPPLTVIDGMFKHKTENQDRELIKSGKAKPEFILPEDYPSGFEWMPQYNAWSKAVFHHFIFSITFIIFMIAIWNY